MNVNYGFDNCSSFVIAIVKYSYSWKHTFKYLGVKVYAVCKLLSNVSENNYTHTHRLRERERANGGKY